MRARFKVYQALSNFWHSRRGVGAENTARIEEIPA
jgi:hypothetical protein